MFGRLGIATRIEILKNGTMRQNLRMRHQPASFDRSALRTSVPGTVGGVIASLMLIRFLFLSI